jgi:hypothetical protein
LNLVVDTWVLFRAKDGDADAILFLGKIIKHNHKVYVDAKGKIITEYESCKCTFARKWLQTIGSRGFAKVRCKKTCKNFLNCTRDMKFVYVCLNSNGSVKDIVSEDYHFVKGRALLLKRGIRQLDLAVALPLA